MKEIDFERLTELEKKLLRWDFDFERKEHDYFHKTISRVFHSLWEKHVTFHDFVFKNFFEDKDEFDLGPLIAKRLFKIPKLGKEKNLKLFLKYLEEAYNVYGCVLNIKKKGEDLIERGFHHMGLSMDLLFEINGQEVKEINQEGKKSDTVKDFARQYLLCRQDCDVSPCFPFACEKVKYNPDYISMPAFLKIDDITSKSEIKKDLCSQMMRILAKTNCSVPYIIEYFHKDYGKRLLLLLPPMIGMTEISKFYMKGISKVRHDFYQKELRGRPESAFYQRDLIISVLEEYKGKRFSINKLCELASEKLKKEEKLDLSPTTIRRHYLKEIREVKQAKNSK